MTDATGEEVWALRGFTVDTVFAERQTDGADIPEPLRPALVTGDGPEGAWAALRDLVEARGYRVERAPLYPSNGQTRFTTKVVTVADRLDEAGALKVLCHEAAHLMLHQPGQVDYHANRARCEAEAESVAFLVCSQLGLATDAYSFPYVATWAQGDMKVVTAAADKALACAADILAALERQGDAVAA